MATNQQAQVGNPVDPNAEITNAASLRDHGLKLFKRMEEAGKVTLAGAIRDAVRPEQDPTTGKWVCSTVNPGREFDTVDEARAEGIARFHEVVDAAFDLVVKLEDANSDINCYFDLPGGGVKHATGRHFVDAACGVDRDFRRALTKAIRPKA